MKRYWTSMCLVRGMLDWIARVAMAALSQILRYMSARHTTIFRNGRTASTTPSQHSGCMKMLIQVSSSIDAIFYLVYDLYECYTQKWSCVMLLTFIEGLSAAVSEQDPLTQHEKSPLELNHEHGI
ncbi:hypothetical protein Tco_1031166 [Tanacetum coccineum]|uniref:Uncharacterized protein n=1 Tax=Tanacetum coccineum TaxID=301880 RepID=A0ABQ5G9P9_9ASTR